MATIAPPQGLHDTDYEAIEAAVTETVRGRWFLSEFARRNRLAESRQLLDAMARLETLVIAGQNALPSADPSIRLLVQRIKEIASQLNGVADAMRGAGVDDALVDSVESQARAVAGMIRSATPAALGPAGSVPIPAARDSSSASGGAPRLPRAHPLTTPANLVPLEEAAPSPSATMEDPRGAILADIDTLPLARKLAIFT